MRYFVVYMAAHRPLRTMRLRLRDPLGVVRERWGDRYDERGDIGLATVSIDVKAVGRPLT